MLVITYPQTGLGCGTHSKQATLLLRQRQRQRQLDPHPQHRHQLQIHAQVTSIRPQQMVRRTKKRILNWYGPRQPVQLITDTAYKKGRSSHNNYVMGLIGRHQIASLLIRLRQKLSRL